MKFEPDSNKLLPSEIKKLEKIGEILKEFPNDLLITGHCAARGTVKVQEVQVVLLRDVGIHRLELVRSPRLFGVLDLGQRREDEKQEGRER